MRFRLYLNGDADARDTHLSLFLVIMRGDYDTNLKWPFSFNVKFQLVDRTTSADGKRHITKAFHFDHTSDCSQRPTCDMNDGCGFKRFLSVEQFEKNQARYVLNDAIFIKSHIDFLNTISPNSSSVGDIPNDEEHVITIN